MAKICDDITCSHCIEATGLNISRINVGKLVVIYLEDDDDLPYYCADDSSCVLKLLADLSREGINVDESCFICTMLDLPIGEDNLPIIAYV